MKECARCGEDSAPYFAGGTWTGNDSSGVTTRNYVKPVPHECGLIPKLIRDFARIGGRVYGGTRTGVETGLVRGFNEIRVGNKPFSDYVSSTHPIGAKLIELHVPCFSSAHGKLMVRNWLGSLIGEVWPAPLFTDPGHLGDLSDNLIPTWVSNHRDPVIHWWQAHWNEIMSGAIKL